MDVVQSLLDRKADPTLTNRDGCTPLDVVRAAWGESVCAQMQAWIDLDQDIERISSLVHEEDPVHATPILPSG